MNKPELTYEAAGVNVRAADRLEERFRDAARATHGAPRLPGARVLEGVGGFAALFAMPTGLEEPVLVSATDGVGTKLKLAIALGDHATVGQDLVAMCANDVVTTGATPLFFLDYFATGALDETVAEAVVRGVADACARAGCALVGGETAELPGLFAPREYDLAGFCVGVAEKKNLLGAARVREGDRLVGLASSGLHANGFALARRAIELAGLELEARVPELGDARTLGRALLEPTRLYVDAARALGLALGADLRALAHVTGGGIAGNVPRVVPEGLAARVELARVARPPVFGLVARVGNVTEAEMRAVFNCGVGMVAIVAPGRAADAIAAAERAGERAFVLGEIARAGGARFEDRCVFV